MPLNALYLDMSTGFVTILAWPIWAHHIICSFGLPTEVSGRSVTPLASLIYSAADQMKQNCLLHLLHPSHK